MDEAWQLRNAVVYLQRGRHDKDYWGKEAQVTEEELAKALSKFLIEHRNQRLTDVEKEMLKVAVDQSRNWQELLAVMMVAGMKN